LGKPNHCRLISPLKIAFSAQCAPFSNTHEITVRVGDQDHLAALFLQRLKKPLRIRAQA